ncbi:MAG: DUF2147 domain-containing protein, partial [Bacteroidota bacterium]
MKNMLLIFGCLLFTAQISAQTGGEKILGTWTTPDQNQVLEFIQDGDTYTAVIRQADQVEAIGKTPISGLEYKGNGSYKNGQIYIPKRDMMANCSTKILNERELKLTIKVGMMSKKVTWT